MELHDLKVKICDVKEELNYLRFQASFYMDDWHRDLYRPMQQLPLYPLQAWTPLLSDNAVYGGWPEQIPSRNSRPFPDHLPAAITPSS